MFNLLVVDDDREILELMSVFLQRPGVGVHAARTLATAQALITQVQPQAAILDVHLTQTCRHEGLELLETLRAQDPQSNAILITGWSRPELLAQAYRRGAAYFMRKPIDLQEMEFQLLLLGMPRRHDTGPTPVTYHGRVISAWQPT